MENSPVLDVDFDNHFSEVEFELSSSRKKFSRFDSIANAIE